MIMLYFLLYAAAAAHLYHYYPQLPEKLATHFGADGAANGWMGRDGFALFYVGIFVFVTGIFALIGWISTKLPDSMINIPNKSYWLAPERRAASRDSFARDLRTMGLITGVFIIGVNHLVISIALQGTGTLDNSQLYCLLGLFAAGFGAVIVRQLFRFRKPDDVK